MQARGLPWYRTIIIKATYVAILLNRAPRHATRDRILQIGSTVVGNILQSD